MSWGRRGTQRTSSPHHTLSIHIYIYAWIKSHTQQKIKEQKKNRIKKNRTKKTNKQNNNEQKKQQGTNEQPKTEQNKEIKKQNKERTGVKTMRETQDTVARSNISSSLNFLAPSSHPRVYPVFLGFVFYFLFPSSVKKFLYCVSTFLPDPSLSRPRVTELGVQMFILLTFEMDRGLWVTNGACLQPGWR